MRRWETLQARENESTWSPQHRTVRDSLVVRLRALRGGGGGLAWRRSGEGVEGLGSGRWGGRLWYRGGISLVSWYRVAVVWTRYRGWEEKKGGGRRLYSVREQQQE